MVANPLLWMEMSNLSEADQEKLSNIISVYKKERKDIFAGEVLPVDGISFNGFQIKTNDTSVYFILFLEYTKHSEYIFKTHDLQEKN